MTLVQALRISQLKPIMHRSYPMEAGRGSVHTWRVQEIVRAGILVPKPMFSKIRERFLDRGKDWKLRCGGELIVALCVSSFLFFAPACLISDLLKAQKWAIPITVILHVNSVRGSLSVALNIIASGIIHFFE